jgi:hypothetical protein
MTSSPGCAEGGGVHERPSAAELVRAVRELLEGPLLAPGQEAEHAGLLAGLGVAGEAELAAGIRAGRFDGRAGEVAAAVRRIVEMSLAVDHPGYARRGS